MDMVKGADCPLTLSVGQWAGVLRCIKKYHSDTKAVVDLERELRIQLDHVVNQYKDHLAFEIFEAEGDDLDETQEIERPKIDSEMLTDYGVALEEEPPMKPEPMKFAAVDLVMFGSVCSLLVSAVWMVL